MVQVGPWGGESGYQPWEFALVDGNLRLSNIRIRSDSRCVYSIQFSQKDVTSGKIQTLKPYGGDGGSPVDIPFDADTSEYPIEIEGTFAPNDPTGNVVITSLKFKTNKKAAGPYGPGGGTPFSLPVQVGQVTGFFGTYGDRFYNLGVTLN